MPRAKLPPMRPIPTATTPPKTVVPRPLMHRPGLMGTEPKLPAKKPRGY